MRLVRFLDVNDDPVYINPAHVAYVRRVVVSSLEGPVAEWSEVGTCGGAVLTLKQGAAQVVAKLR